MNCRTVSLAVVLCALLAGCETYYAVRRDIGIDPADPPRQPMAATPAVAMSPPPAVRQAEMPASPSPQSPAAMPTRQDIAQANWTAQRAATLTVQDNTAPVGYKPQEMPPAPIPAATAKPMPIAPGPAPAGAAPHGVAVPKPPTPAAGLPPGYKPSMAAADPAHGAAAHGTAPAMKPEMAAAAGAPVWRAHLASHRTEGAAINEWEQLLKANPKLYDQFDPQILWADIPRRGAFARLTMGVFADRKAAEAACQKVRGPRRYCAPLKE